MRIWVSLALLAALFPLGQPFASAAAETSADATARASYRRPAAIPFPDRNPYTVPKAALGERLFFDALLSKSRTRSCATCHNPSLSWGDGLARAVGEDPSGLPLRAPTLIDVAFTEPLGWDGKFKTLEAVTFGPITGRPNMNLTESELIARLSAIPAYADAFAAAFGDGAITRPRIEAALATFERTIVAGEAPFDRWIMGDVTSVSAAAKRGFEIFNGKAHCSNCHSGPSFTDGFTILASQGTTTLDAVGFFRRRKSCGTHSKRRHCAMSRGVLPTCMMDRSQPSKRSSNSMTRVGLTVRAARLQ